MSIPDRIPGIYVSNIPVKDIISLVDKLNVASAKVASEESLLKAQTAVDFTHNLLCEEFGDEWAQASVSISAWWLGSIIYSLIEEEDTIGAALSKELYKLSEHADQSITNYSKERMEKLAKKIQDYVEEQFQLDWKAASLYLSSSWVSVILNRLCVEIKFEDFKAVN